MVEEGGEGRGSTKHTVQRVALRHFITVCHNPGTTSRKVERTCCAAYAPESEGHTDEREEC